MIGRPMFTGPLLPHLFQRKIGWRSEIISSRVLCRLLNDTLLRGGLTDRAGQPLRYTFTRDFVVIDPRCSVCAVSPAPNGAGSIPAAVSRGAGAYIARSIALVGRHTVRPSKWWGNSCRRHG
ncbi:hypothetical protein [Amycolatopsis sp. MtRt-6]|uniref:hypothetical protein n=1 Tax=Amycolatopsis sp. MtRt-6 TaxID=2792782 RepID=UPI001A8CFA96|nr:hypothetical protein [Amycolatopsis sp. MtRt-6]